jgi:hypothetical protein
LSPAALAQLYEQPTLIIDPGMHTAPIKDVGVDAAGRMAVTRGLDKTLRVWSLCDGRRSCKRGQDFPPSEADCHWNSST